MRLGCCVSFDVLNFASTLSIVHTSLRPDLASSLLLFFFHGVFCLQGNRTPCAPRTLLESLILRYAIALVIFDKDDYSVTTNDALCGFM